jgi:hypothetical protein
VICQGAADAAFEAFMVISIVIQQVLSSAELISDSSDMHTPRHDVDDKDHVVPNQPEPSQYLHRQEIRAGNRAKMGLDERVLPTRMAPTFRRRLDSAFLENCLGRVAGEVMPQVE